MCWLNACINSQRVPPWGDENLVLMRGIGLVSILDFCCAMRTLMPSSQFPEVSMDACETRESEDRSIAMYRSRRGALAWFFRKSRDNWKEKYQKVMAMLKRLRGQLAAVTKSRETWRLKAEQAATELISARQEIEELRAQVRQLEENKKRRLAVGNSRSRARTSSDS